MKISTVSLQCYQLRTSPHFRHRNYITYLIIPLLIVMSFFISNRCRADEKYDDLKSRLENYTGIYKHKLDDGFTIRGWQLTPHIYLGQTRTFGNNSYGLLVDKGDYAYGLIDQQISILKSF